MKKEQVLSEEQAVEEMQGLCEKFEEKTYDSEKILERYPDVINSLKFGYLVVDGDKLFYTLRQPVKGEDSETIYHEKLDLRTRIKPKTAEDLSKGISASKEQVKYLNRCVCYVAGLDLGIYNELNKFDQKTLEQITTLFL